MKRSIYYQCDLCTAFVKEENAHRLGWDWFKGYLRETVHICRKCQDEKVEEVVELFEKSRIKPETP